MVPFAERGIPSFVCPWRTRRRADADAGFQIQNKGVRTARGQRATLQHSVRTRGRVDHDETPLAPVQPWRQRCIEDLQPRTEGRPVPRGQRPAAVSAPAIPAAKTDLVPAFDPPRKASLPRMAQRAGAADGR